MFCVYIIYSQASGDIYVGSTANLNWRLKLHQSGKVKSTKGYRPWRLLEFYEYDTRSEAVIAEKFFKSHQQKELIRKRYNLK